MVDFREYLVISDHIDDEDFYEDEDDEFYDEDEYFVSPFDPIDLGDYILYLNASEASFCSPMVNSDNPYTYDAWELMIEKKDDRYDKVIVTHTIFNELGYGSFEDDDVYAAFVPNELIQELFDYLIQSIKIPKLEEPTKKKKKVDKKK